MKRALCTLVWASILSWAFTALADDWITSPSYFTHDPQTGERVRQYSPIGPFYVNPRADFLTSGYHHTRSSIRVGGSADNLHVVEEWGRPVRPYGEWQFPFRPYSVPYDLWGPPWYGFGWGSNGPPPGPYSQGRSYPYPGFSGPGSSESGAIRPGPFPGSSTPGFPSSPMPGSGYPSSPSESGSGRDEGHRTDSSTQMR